MATTPVWRRPIFILVSCIVMVMISCGTVQSIGLFMRPISLDMNWGHEVLSFAIATQNLLIGAFTGIWIGDYVFDVTQSYGAIWLIAIALGFTTALIHLPIDEKPLARVPAT